MTNPIKIRATVKGDDGEVRILIPHPMENGQRRDPSGQIPPAHYITTMSVTLNGRAVIEGALGTAVSSNPLFAFQLRGVRVGDRIGVSWEDNLGQKGAAEAPFSAG